MKRIRSKALYQYLLEAGVLSGTPEAIGIAKRKYRKQYKKQWKERKRPRKELRIEISLREYATIKSQALTNGLKPTTYARNVLLASTGQNILIPYKDELLEVLQILSMTVIASFSNMPARSLSNELEEAERHLLHYLSR